MTIPENLRQVRARMAQAARRAQRSPDEITLVAVSKTKPLALIAETAAAGQVDFGENRLEELWPKADAAAAAGLNAIRWHAIGTIQSRKAKTGAGAVRRCAQAEPLDAICLIHAVDRPKIAQRLSRQAAEQGRTLDVLLEVNVSGEESKHGFSPASLIAALPIAARPAGTALLWADDDGPVCRRCRRSPALFRKLRCLLEELRHTFPAATISPRHLAASVYGHDKRFRSRHRRGRHNRARWHGDLRPQGVRMKQLQGKITFVGGGAMGEAIIGSLISKQLLNPTQICVSEPVPTRREYLNSTYGVTTETDNSQAVTGASVAVLAVKPQVLGPVMADLKGNLPPAALVVSIMAGVQIDTLQSGLCHDKIVRSMPNTPAQVGKGMTVWTDTAAVTESDRAAAQSILEAMGEAIYAAEEHYLDMATGLSGSGPGFVYLLLEALIDAGVHIGFSRDQAQLMVLQTVEGSVELMRQSGLHPADLRNRVTSPAGTTAAGTFVLERAGVRSALIDAVDAAYRRSQELGGS